MSSSSTDSYYLSASQVVSKQDLSSLLPVAPLRPARVDDLTFFNHRNEVIGEELEDESENLHASSSQRAGSRLKDSNRFNAKALADRALPKIVVHSDE